MYKMPFDANKSLETLLYIAQHCSIKDIYHILKIHFFADRKHLERNARFITGDNYIAMKNGPVASNAYNFLRVARGETIYLPPTIENEIKSSLSVNGYMVTALRESNTDYLSKSDIYCLDESIAENGLLSFNELNEKSHGLLWQEADLNNVISFESFVNHSQNSEQLRAYLND